MYVICSDLEGVFVPEVWINVAEKTGIPELRLTTRDVADYNVLMKQRIRILAEHGLKLKDIQNVERFSPKVHNGWMPIYSMVLITNRKLPTQKRLNILI